jgi:radical SAM superfamily enzyme YgiQ (UPF0313 family)
MSGIRAYDPELLRLGLTLPGFVERSKTIASLPSLGLLTLAGMTPPEHEISYLEVDDIRDLEVLPDDFDLVAISSYSAQMQEGYELADRYRERGIATVLGGPHVTWLWHEAAEHADAVVVGEGESSWPDVVSDAAAGRLQLRYGSLESEFDLADAPMPAFELLDIGKYNRLTVQTSRGCPHRCEFCGSSVFLSRQYKQKPIVNVLAEIDRILDIWEQPFIEFADDNGIVDSGYWRELLPEIRRRRIRWFTETDLSISEHPDLLEMMRASGCAQVLVGFESPREEDLDGLETRGNWKHRHWSSYRNAIHEIQSHGITVNGCFILGLDGQGPDIFDAVDRFVRESELYDVQITIQTPFPGTPLLERLEAEGRMRDTDRWRRCTLFDVTYDPKGMTADQLARGFRELGVRLYGAERTRERKERFKRQLATSRPRKQDQT